MFTGIIETVGRITRVQFPRLEVVVSSSWKGIKVGSSIAVDGVCLTVIKRQGSRLSFDVVEETRRKTTLGTLQAGSPVNLERALALGDRFEGHFVTGHVEGVGKILNRVKHAVQEKIEIEVPKSLLRFIVSKGSVAVDGISLTVGKINSTRNSLFVYLIPHTLKNTTLGIKKISQKVNIETDLLAKYVVLGNCPSTRGL